MTASGARWGELDSGLRDTDFGLSARITGRLDAGVPVGRAG